ncbi:MAG: arginine--tRNA ligase [Deltaproteobacteria bacterium]|nr:arginine--tRNA ligase [Deltaproteobacteria bacterium]
MALSFIKKIADFLSKKTGQNKEDLILLIEHPPSLELGNYSFPCFGTAKVLKKNPDEVARELALQFPVSKYFKKAEAKGPYLNFFIDPLSYQTELISEILNQKENYGASNIGQNKTILIEYSSPNIAKPFHVGHFRATIIGNSLKKIHEALGYKVIGINYLGDWGTQFGKLIVAYKKWGAKAQLKKDPIKYLNSLYIQFHSEAEKNPSLEDEARLWFKKCEEKNKEALALWKEFRELSLKEFKKIYAELDVHFDEISGESLYDEKIAPTISYIKSKIQTQISEGALIINLEKYKMPPALLLRKDGASLYLTRDIAALLDRYNRYHFDKILYVVGDTQNLHFQQLFKLIELMGNPWAKECHHIAFGQIRLKDQKMSTRKGTAILLEEVLDKSIELIAKIIEEKNASLKGKQEVAQKVGSGAIIFADFSSRRIKNVTFDWDVILNPDGDTGPYVLYTYARASSILRKAQGKAPTSFLSSDLIGELTGESTLLESQEEQELMKALECFPKTLTAAAHDFEPSYIATTLLDVSKLFNRFYHEHRVIQEDEALQASRLKLVSATRQVLKNGLNLLGIQEVEEL